MTWHHVAMAVIGVATGIGGFLVPGATAFTTPVAWTLVGGALGNATVGPALMKVLGGKPPAPTTPSSDSPRS